MAPLKLNLTGLTVNTFLTFCTGLCGLPEQGYLNVCNCHNFCYLRDVSGMRSRRLGKRLLRKDFHRSVSKGPRGRNWATDEEWLTVRIA